MKKIIKKTSAKLQSILLVAKRRGLRSWDVALFAIVILFFILVAQAISSATRNWELERRLAGKRKELELLELEVETMELENKYYQSEEYQELMTRKLHKKKLKDETMVWLEEPTDMAKDRDRKKNIKPEKKPSNARQWLAFLLNI